MTGYIQETDSKMVIPVSDNPISFPITFENQTYGGELFYNFIPLSTGTNLIDRALEPLRENENPEISARARETLKSIQEKIDTLIKYKIDILYLPKIRAFNVDDGSILLEWIFEDFRIGFSIEPIDAESSWYLVTSQKYGEISASGYISDINFKNIILWLINFIMVNT